MATDKPSTISPVSPILTMHARYEATWAEYNTIDAARTAFNTENASERFLDFRYADAMKTISAETDALRLAIFYQVPTSWKEALILQYHIHSIFDPTQVGPEDEQKAISTAVETLLDFMCCEVEAHHDGIGHQFQVGANLVSDNRRYRTGKLAKAA